MTPPADETSRGQARPRRRRDPTARRAAMVQAAMELVTEEGTAALTHRAVAARADVSLGTTTSYFASIDELREVALVAIADRIDEALVRVDRDLAAAGVTAESLTAVFQGFLADRREARESIILAHAALSDPRVRELSSRAATRLIESLTRHVGADRAAALQVYLDGAIVSTGARGVTISVDQLTRAIAAILAMAPVCKHKPTR